MTEHISSEDNKPDDGAAVLALVRKVGLAGFVRPEKAPIVTFANLRELFRRNRFKQATHGGWRPRPNDWMALAIELAVKHKDQSLADYVHNNVSVTVDTWISLANGLAVHHGEKGIPSCRIVHRRAEWAEHVRFSTMNSVYLREDDDGMLMPPCVENKKTGQSYVNAAKEAIKILEARRRQYEKHGWHFDPMILKTRNKTNDKSNGLAVEYCKYLKRIAEHGKPLSPALVSYLRLNRDFGELLQVSRAFTLWPLPE